MSKHSELAGDLAGLFALFSKLPEERPANAAHNYPIVWIQEAGLDGFWFIGWLKKKGGEKPRRGPSFKRDIAPAQTGKNGSHRR